jgi:hypothetical protein
LSTFDTVEILAEFSKAVRHSLIALESLHDLDGIDQAKVGVLAESVRHAHADATAYLVSIIGRAESVEAGRAADKPCAKPFHSRDGLR